MIRCMLLCLLLAAPAVAQVRVLPVEPAISGFSPHIAVDGLAPGASARIHAFASYPRWDEDKKAGRWVQTFTTYHAWADVTADRRGRIDMDRYAVTRGTYRGVDGYGLLWSMRKPTDPDLADATPNGDAAPTPARGKTVLLVTQGPRVVGYGSLSYVEPPNLTVIPVEQGRLNGVFAAPAAGERRPAIILLHGSEGGGAEEARDQATRFAGQGYAAFALNYFAWDLKKLKGPPNYHVNQPVELIAAVRNWLAARPEVDARRIGVYGHSKGAEYAAVAASYYPWIKAVIACVPSDAVWEGYGINDGRNIVDPNLKWPAQRSFWSWQGRPLPYIPLYTWADRKWFDNTELYSTSRREHPAEARAASIPVERSRARYLLLGGGKDEVWGSGEMAAALGKRLGRRATTVVYPTAGHQICGAGTYPSHIWADPSSDPRVKDPTAEGAAQVDAWERMKRFLKRVL